MSIIEKRLLYLMEKFRKESMNLVVNDGFLLSGVDKIPADGIRSFRLIGMQLNEWGFSSLYGSVGTNFVPSFVVGNTVKNAIVQYPYIEISLFDAFF